MVGVVAHGGCLHNGAVCAAADRETAANASGDGAMGGGAARSGSVAARALPVVVGIVLALRRDAAGAVQPLAAALMLPLHLFQGAGGTHTRIAEFPAAALVVRLFRSGRVLAHLPCHAFRSLSRLMRTAKRSTARTGGIYQKKHA
jgi:hypothetical protein